jgi:hypothetical protein
MNADPFLTLSLQLSEVNLVLNALAVQPFNQVNALIARIGAQAKSQLDAPPKQTGRPRGSKNKPKTAGATDGTNANNAQ